ncbi:MAG: hypothetical protein MUE72_01005 [Chitinophagaceae bacterium]|jgi:hypothetical protein|nr:hypothetical protein [Chitinophagaceae bacterium]
MNNEEKKQALQDLLSTADEGLTNVLMEAAEAYQKKVQEEFIIPQEWIEEANRVSAAIKNGDMKTHTLEETIERTKQFFKTKYNVDYTPNI